MVIIILQEGNEIIDNSTCASKIYKIGTRKCHMFYLTSFKDKFEGVKLNAWGETVFFLSKIFISYGIYQTIVAFRKFSK